MVVHGAGSFGHWQAREHRTKEGWYPGQGARGVSDNTPHEHACTQQQEARHGPAARHEDAANNKAADASSNGRHEADGVGGSQPAQDGSAQLRRAAHVDRSRVQGFAAVRRSVCHLNSVVVSALVKADVPAVGLPPFPLWECADGVLASGRVDLVSARRTNAACMCSHDALQIPCARPCNMEPQSTHASQNSAGRPGVVQLPHASAVYAPCLSKNGSHARA